MGKKLYIGGLSYSTTDQSLAEAFAKAGTVESANVIVDRETQRSRGFGFVEMSSDDEAKAAIDMFDGQELEGRRLKVNEARPLADRAPRG